MEELEEEILEENDYGKKYYKKDKSDLDMHKAIQYLDDYYEEELDDILDLTSDLFFTLSLLKGNQHEELEPIFFGRVYQQQYALYFKIYKGLKHPEYIEEAEKLKKEYQLEDIEYNIVELIKDREAIDIARSYCKFDTTKNIEL